MRVRMENRGEVQLLGYFNGKLELEERGPTARERHCLQAPSIRFFYASAPAVQGVK